MKFINYLLEYILGWIWLRFRGVDCDFMAVRVIGVPRIIKHKNSTIHLRGNVTLISSVKYNPAGLTQPVSIATLAEGASILIEEGASLSGAVLCAVESIKIGRNAMLGANVKLYDTDFHCVWIDDRLSQTDVLQANHASVVIGSGVWLGADVMVLKGVNIGNNCVVGARALVTQSLPNNTVSVGVPARVIKELD